MNVHEELFALETDLNFLLYTEVMEEIACLAMDIAWHKSHYYMLAESKISDWEYDSLERKYMRLCYSIGYPAIVNVVDHGMHVPIIAGVYRQLTGLGIDSYMWHDYNPYGQLVLEEEVCA